MNGFASIVVHVVVQSNYATCIRDGRVVIVLVGISRYWSVLVATNRYYWISVDSSPPHALPQPLSRPKRLDPTSLERSFRHTCKMSLVSSNEPIKKRESNTMPTRIKFNSYSVHFNDSVHFDCCLLHLYGFFLCA